MDTGKSQGNSGINEVTGRIIGAAIEVHRALGPGLLESAYEACLVLTYLKPSGHRLGLPISFNVAVLHQGVRRFLNGRPERGVHAP